MSLLLNKRKIYATLLECAEEQKNIHLKTLLKNEKRNNFFFVEYEDIWLDFCRQKLDEKVLNYLFQLADEVDLKKEIEKMFSGEKINNTENRSVMHFALRFPEEKKKFFFDEKILQQILQVKYNIQNFANQIRNGDRVGFTGKKLNDIIVIGIGGSYLGTEFVFEALKNSADGFHLSQGKTLRFLANVDPVDVKKATEGLSPETTLVIIVSKTFTTAETLLNAKTLKHWILDYYKNDINSVASHMCAVSTNLKATKEFGINDNAVFGFWDWVGGRYSVTSSVGILPLTILFGWDLIEQFLQGCHSIDMHFLKENDYSKNIPILMGLLSVWNSTFLGFNSVAVLPYCQALSRFPAHIQQLCMESNGKQKTKNGEKICEYKTGEIFFGEPGTNSQHSFFQLMHQGRKIPAEFIGFCKSQNPIKLSEEEVSNHDELMSNYFAQADALAFGKNEEKYLKETPNIDCHILPHKIFEGNRPSILLLFKEANAYNIGRLLAIYEHRTAVEGFIWGINSFDQFGVELGKVLAKEVRSFIKEKRKDSNADDSKFCSSTKRMLSIYTRS